MRWNPPDKIEKWDARILQSKMAEYAHLPTPIDSLILALGRTRDPKALPALLRKLETLDESVTLSHHRALAIALEQIGDPGAAEPLARLLAKSGMRGHAMKSVEPLHDEGMDRRRRLGPMREITVARALYHCGDYNGLGAAILREYRMIFVVYLRGMREPFWLKPNRLASPTRVTSPDKLESNL